MSLNININALGGNDKIIINHNSSKNKNTFFAGDSNLAKDPISEKRKEAREKALRIVQNAWENQLDVDKTIQSKLDQYQKIQEVKDISRKELESIDSKKAELQKLYGVESNSIEQKDLNLLERREDNKSGLSSTAFTKEEMERLAELDESTLTEYQNRSLELNKQGIKFKKEIQNADQQMTNLNDNIRSINKELLKSNPMLDAQKNSEEIMEAASKEIVGMLLEESKEHMDGKLEEIEEKAEKIAEEGEAKEEKLELLREMRAIQAAIIAGTKEAIDRAEAKQRENDILDLNIGDLIEITKSLGQMEDAQKSLQSIKNSMNLVEADLKGIKVNQEI